MTRRIGVEVTTATRGGPSNPGAPAGLYHIAGLTERGPVGKVVTVRSIPEFERHLGGRTPYSGPAYDAARLFFSEGGSQLMVSRVAGADAEPASVTLLPPGEEVNGDPVARVELSEVGGFGNGGTVTVDRAEDTYTITVEDADGEALATWRGISTLDELASRGRSNANVNVVTLTEQDDLSLATDTYTLEGGSDDRGSVTSDDVVAALDAAADAADGGAVAAPGYPADVIGEALISHAANHRKIALLAADADATPSGLAELSTQLQEHEHAEYAGLFYPHIEVPDASGSRLVSPESLAAAARARTFATGAYWNMAAGTDRGRARWATGTTPALARVDVERLDESHINGVETGQGRVYLNNWTSLATDRENLGKLRDADVLNNLSVQFERALEQYVWETIDGRGLLHSDVDSAVTAILSEMAAAGGLFPTFDDAGEEIDPGYSVVVNPDPALAAEDRVEVSAAVRLSGTAKLISVGLIKVAIGGQL